MTKKQAYEKAREYLSDRISKLEQQILRTRKKAADAPGSMESWSDKSKDEFSQLAGALSRELDPLKKSLRSLGEWEDKAFAKVQVGAFVEVLMSDKKNYLLMLDIGGEKINELFLLSKDSELGKALTGHKTNDLIDWRSGTVKVISIQ